MRKRDLPEKPCATCGRPFRYRRRWAHCWDEVRHCSDACRGRRGAAPLVVAPSPDSDRRGQGRGGRGR